jgi:UDP-N-acetylglucosamine--N-acetylmuramyl-(pentapeptide) pyrophosphoryl-undecaprenol N-acetylglucosamine transferase
MKILIVTGGSGGHVIPAQSLYEYLKNNYSVDLAVDTRGSKYLIQQPKYKWNSHSKYSFIRWFWIVFYTFKCFFIIYKYDKIIFFGTYHSVSFILAGFLWQKQLYFHEQNVILSRVNNLFSQWGTLMTTWPNNKGILTGMPVRNYTQQIKKPFSILISLGSQEAPLLKPLINNIFRNLPKNLQKKITIITAPNNFIKDKDLFMNVEYFNTSFGNNIMNLYSSCTMAIGRGGAGFLYEMMMLKIPTISIPLKNSVNNHQYFNSKFIVDSGLGIMIFNDEDIIKGSDFIKKVMVNKLPIKDNYVIENSCQLIESILLKN